MTHVLNGGAMITALLCLVASILVLTKKNGAIIGAEVAIVLAIGVLTFTGWYFHEHYRTDFIRFVKDLVGIILIIVAICVACFAAYMAALSETHAVPWAMVSIVSIVLVAFSFESVRHNVSRVFEEMIDAGKTALGIEEKVSDEEQKPRYIDMSWMPDSEWAEEFIEAENRWLAEEKEKRNKK